MYTDRFKFRIYDIENHVYINNDAISLCTRYEDNSQWLIYIKDNYNSNNYLIEQCTGLTDSTGKLIYEGDKIQWSDVAFTGQINKHQEDVIWDNERCCFNGVICHNIAKVIGTIHD